MREVSQLVQDFDDRIVLSAEKLYEKFGRENGAGILSRYFSSVTWESYPDHLVVPDAQPLISLYPFLPRQSESIYSGSLQGIPLLCGEKNEHGFHITKDAGLFLCEKVTNLKKL